MKKIMIGGVLLVFFRRTFLRNFSCIFIFIVGAFFMWRIMKYDFPICNFNDMKEVFSSASARNINISNMIQWHYIYVLFLCPLIVLSVKNLSCYKFPPTLTSMFDKIISWLDPVLSKCEVFIFAFAFTTAVYIPICFIISSIIIVNSLRLLLYLSMFFSIFICILLILVFVDYSRMAYICTPIFKASALFIFFAELLYWLHDHRIAVTPLYAVVIYYFPAVIKTIYNKYRKGLTKLDWDRIYLYASIAVIGISVMRSSAPFDVDFFEWSNHGNAIYGFLHTSEIPIIQNFDPHMLSSFIWGILYAFINGDYAGAVFSPYSYFNTILTCLGLFLLCQKFIPSKYVFWGILFFPLSMIRGTYFMGIWLLLYFMNWTRNKHSVLSNFVYALLFVFSSLFLLDIGASWGIAFIICGLCYIILNDSSHKISFLLAVSTVGILFSVLFIFLLYINRVDALSWLQKFLTACFSNQNWAYGVLGSKLSVLIVYCICPIIMIGIAIHSLIELKHKTTSIKSWTILFLCLTWVLNMQRALVRHSMLEKSAITFGLILIVFTLYVFIYYDKYQSIMILSFVVVLLAFSTIEPKILSRTNNIFLSFVRKPALILESTLSPNNTVINMSKRSAERISDVKNFFNNTLTSSDTFLDFTNQTLLYSLTGREKAMYVNQSPGLVNGVRGQKEFISEISISDKLPIIALMPHVSNNFEWWGGGC